MSVPTEISIHEAVRSGDLTTVEKILQRDPSCVNDWDLDYMAPLHLIYDDVYGTRTQADHKLPMMQLLIDYGADLNAGGGLCLNTALHFAVKKQQVNGVRLLLEKKANPNIKNEFDYTALHLTTNNVTILELLLDYNADVNIPNYKDQTPLDTAILGRCVDCVEGLIRSKAKSKKIYEVLLNLCSNMSKLTQEEEDIDNTTAQCHRHEQVLFFEYVLGHATEIDFYDKFSLKALFYYAVSKNHEKDHLEYDKCLLFELLKKHGIDVINVRSITRDSELHLAVRDADDTKVEVLLRKGANVNETNFFGETPMHLVLKQLRLCYESETIKRNERIASLLDEYKTDWWIHNYFDESSFALAARIRNVTLVNLLRPKIRGVEEEFFIRPYRNRFFTLRMYLRTDKFMLDELLVAIALHQEQLVRHLLDTNFVIETHKNNRENISRALHMATTTNQLNTVKMLLEADFRAEENFNNHVPCFINIQYEENDLKFASLFWEFKDRVTIDRALIYTLQGVVQYAIVNKFTYLIIFYYAIHLHLNEPNASLIPVKGLFKLHKDLSMILSDCNEKLDELMTIKVGNLSIYDVITMPQNSLVKSFNNTNLVDTCMNYCSSLKDREELEYYEHAVKTRIDLAVEKRQLLDSAKDSLNNAFQSILSVMGFKSLPDLIMWNILTCVNTRELKKITKINVRSAEGLQL